MGEQDDWALRNAQAIADAVFTPLLAELGFPELEFRFEQEDEPRAALDRRARREEEG